MNILVRQKRPASTDLARPAIFGVAEPTPVLELEAKRAKEQNAAASATMIGDAIDEALEWARRP